MPPALSIIIVNWNTAHFLCDCLASIYQHLKSVAFEVIIVDNASHDDSIAQVRANFPQANLICNPVNLGLAKANNLAIRKVQGKYILLLNSDTLLLTDLGDICQWLDGHPQIGMAGAKVLDPDYTIQETCVRKFPTIFSKITNYFRVGSQSLHSLIPYLESPPNFDYGKSQPVELVSGAFMLVPRSVITQIGLFNEAFFLYGEDVDWAQRLHQSGYQIWYSPLASIIHFGSQSSMQIASKTHFIRLKSIAQYFDLYRGKQYGYFYRYWMWLIALLGYLPIALLWLITPSAEYKSHLKAFLIAFGYILRDPFLTTQPQV